MGTSCGRGGRRGTRTGTSVLYRANNAATPAKNAVGLTVLRMIRDVKMVLTCRTYRVLLRCFFQSSCPNCADEGRKGCDSSEPSRAELPSAHATAARE